MLIKIGDDFYDPKEICAVLRASDRCSHPGIIQLKNGEHFYTSLYPEDIIKKIKEAAQGENGESNDQHRP